MFTKFIAVLESLASHPFGMTVGEIDYLNISLGLSRGQWQRVLSSLEDEGFIRMERHRHGRTGKNVWFINEVAVEYCAFVTRRYAEQSFDGSIPF